MGLELQFAWRGSSILIAWLHISKLLGGWSVMTHKDGDWGWKGNYPSIINTHWLMYRIVMLCPISVCRYMTSYQIKLLKSFQMCIMDGRRETHCSRLFPLLGIPRFTQSELWLDGLWCLQASDRSSLESGMSGKNWTAFESTSLFPGKQHSSHYLTFLPSALLENETSDELTCQRKREM